MIGFVYICTLSTFLSHFSARPSKPINFKWPTHKSKDLAYFHHYFMAVSEPCLTLVFNELENKGICIFFKGHDFNDPLIRQIAGHYKTIRFNLFEYWMIYLARYQLACLPALIRRKGGKWQKPKLVKLGSERWPLVCNLTTQLYFKVLIWSDIWQLNTGEDFYNISIKWSNSFSRY